MHTLSKFIGWIRGSKSDFPLFVLVLILANLVAANTFLRLDLTSEHSYSLSDSSRQLVRSLDEPLAIKVFFSSNLPSPYNGVQSYLKDLLVEYGGVGNQNFSYQFFDMEKPENRDLAQSYGINMVQIQEVKDTEVGLKGAYMGLAIIYSDGIKVLDKLTSTDGLEYQLTTTIGKMVSTSTALSGLTGKVQMSLYASSVLKQFGIAGYADLEKTVSDIYTKVNQKNQNKIEFKRLDPTIADVHALASKYGLQEISWKAQNNQPAGSGLLGIVLEYQDRFKTIPLTLGRGLLGGYGITGLDQLEGTVSDTLPSLMSKSLVVGYTTGHGEKNLQDSQKGAAVFSQLISDVYEFKEIDTSKDEIPGNISSLVINGPRQEFSEAELYKIDQFLMRGGNLFLLLDPFEEIAPQGQNFYGAQPVYRPIQSGLERLLKKYGITPQSAYVLDKNCYIARQQNTGEIPVYYAPLLGRSSLNQDNPVSRNLAFVQFLQTGALDINKDADPAHLAIPLADSSAESWLMKDNINLMPYSMQPPAADAQAAQHLVVLLEGKFNSAFDHNPQVADSAGTALASSSYLPISVQSAKIIIAASSAITEPSLMDASAQQPIAVFVRNAIDYLNGNADMIEMRTKGLGLNTLDKTDPTVRLIANAINEYGLPLLVALLGLFVWRRRVIRRHRIQARFAPIQKSGTEE